MSPLRLALLSLLPILGGCSVSIGGGGGDFTSGTCVPVQIRIVDVTPETLATIITSPLTPQPTGISYQYVLLPPELAEPLVRGARPEIGLIMNETRDECFWPGSGRLWSYTHSQVESTVWGSGTGEIGIRSVKAGIETRLKYDMQHQADSDDLMKGDVSYSGTVQPGQSVVFFAPYICKNGQRCIHAVLFTYGQPRQS